MNSNEYIASGNIEAYVLGLCSPEEKAEVELLRTTQPEINDAILKFEIELEQQFLNNPSTTSIQLDKQILQSLQALQTPVIAIQQPLVKKLTWLKPVAAAAILLLAFSSIFNYTLYKKNKEQELALIQKQPEVSLPATDYGILKNPAITPVAMYGVGLHAICRCTLFWDKKTGKAYIMIHHLVPSGPQNNYQLWAMVNQKPVSVGIVNDKIRDRFIEVSNVPKDATGFSVTLEKMGGNTTPTEDETYLVGRI
jgi:anti-sigma-K factor RskA